MPLTTGQLNRATLERQLLLHRQAVPVPEAVRRVVALQAQEPASPYLALWNRIADFAPGDLDTAFVEGAVVKATLIRITLHAVVAQDWAPFHQAMLPALRGSRLADRRFTAGAHTAADADALLPDLVQFAARARTGKEIVAFLEERLGADAKGMWWALRTFAPMRRVPSGGAWAFTTVSSFQAAVTPAQVPTELAARAHLLERYLAGFGPASIQDFAQFSLLRRPAARDALGVLANRVEAIEGPDGTTLYDLPGAPRPAAEVVAPARLLPMWDSVLLAYVDRSRLVPPRYRPAVFR